MATVRLIYLLAQLEIDNIVVNLRENRLRWFVHVDQISGAFKTVCDMQIKVGCGPGRPKTAWMTLIFKGSLSFSGVLVWNSIPLDIKNSTSLQMFSKRCSEWIKQ